MLHRTDSSVPYSFKLSLCNIQLQIFFCVALPEICGNSSSRLKVFKIQIKQWRIQDLTLGGWVVWKGGGGGVEKIIKSVNGLSVSRILACVGPISVKKYALNVHVSRAKRAKKILKK